MKRKHTDNELVAMVRDINLIISIEDITKIVDTYWPFDYKDTFIVPEGEALIFRGSGILANGKTDVPRLKALGEKKKATELLLRRSLINRILAGETDSLREPLTPEAIGRFEKERDLIQASLLRAVCPLDPNGTMLNPEIALQPEIDTPKARKVFEKALKAGYLKQTSSGYKWQESKAAAAYLCEKVYCQDIREKHPNWTLLGQFLCLSRLDQAAYQNIATKSVRPWRRKMDELLKD